MPINDASEDNPTDWDWDPPWPDEYCDYPACTSQDGLQVDGLELIQ